MESLEAYDVVRRMNDAERNISELLQHKVECDIRHTQHEEIGRRRDDATRMNTESNLALAARLDTICQLLQTVVNILDVENGAPEIKIVRTTRNFGLTGWKIFLAIGAAAAVITGIIMAYKSVTGL